MNYLWGITGFVVGFVVGGPLGALFLGGVAFLVSLKVKAKGIKRT